MARRLAALVALSAMGATMGVVPSFAVGETVANGTARVTAIAPISGGLSLEVGLGSAIADLKGTTPRAEAATLKPGIVGLLAGSTVPLPTASKADLRREPSVDSSSVAPPVDVGAVRLTATRERASVTGGDDPLSAAARTDLSDLVVAGTAELSGGTAEASATPKEATGTSAIGRLTIGIAGKTVVDLHDLQWRVRSELGEPPEAAFSIGAAVIQGERRSIDSPAELAAALEPLKPLLLPAGLRIAVPTVEEVAGGALLSPLVIESVNAELLRSTVGAAYPSIAPVYNELATQLQGQVPEAGLALLVANVGASVASGNGGARVLLGGASASIGSRESFTAAGFGGGGGGTSGASSTTGTSSSPFGSTEVAFSDGGSSFFNDGPAARLDGVSAPPAGGSTGASSAATSPIELGTVPLDAEDVAMTPLVAKGSSLPATLVFAAVLAVVTTLAARDQMTVRRRDALRQARARSVSI